MEIKKKAKFRVSIQDLESRKIRVVTVYENHSKMSFLEFVENIKKKIGEM